MKRMKRKTRLMTMSCQGAPVQEKNLLATRIAHTNGPNRENRLILQPLIIPATVPSEAINHLPSLSAQEPGAKHRSRATAGAMTKLILNYHHTHSASQSNVGIMNKIYTDNGKNKTSLSVCIYVWSAIRLCIRPFVVLLVHCILLGEKYVGAFMFIFGSLVCLCECVCACACVFVWHSQVLKNHFHNICDITLVPLLDTCKLGITTITIYKNIHIYETHAILQYHVKNILYIIPCKLSH